MDYALEIDSVGKRYEGFTLSEVSLRLPRGYIMGLIGPNGAGKTTLIKLIMNLIRRDGGAIRIFGLDNLADEAAVKSRIGFVPDEPRYHEDVTLKDLASAVAPFYAKWDERRFRTLAGEFELPLEKKFKKLSHGTKTKFALALALSHGAELLLLDEPTSGLDPVFRRRLLDMLAGLLQDERTSVLFSSHITADLERTADFVTFLLDGRVVFSNPMDQLADNWAVVKGGREMLDAEARAFLQGVRVRRHGFEGLTSQADEARHRFGDGFVIERASLDDIMVLYGKEGANDE
ncbi:MAG: sodium ABC transporter ATP-binding protein [Gemmatimonas sp. SM23_52]|nr:MAG: sodium ABC transporter ATP-binding protein [Gemmatimonas sp. SM23_52]